MPMLRRLTTMPKSPLIAVIGAPPPPSNPNSGTTGVGKSQLSIELAQALHGQVINADAMQMFRGADVLTNKVSTDEMQGVKHHLLGVLDVRDKCDVGMFRRWGREVVSTHCRPRGVMVD
jgi:tRNA A37 N6-isopentenylltransferase MiaA